MIVGGKNKETGMFVFQVYDASNKLFATVEGSDYQATNKMAEDAQREALSPIMDGYKMTENDWNDPLLAGMSDDELLSELMG